MSPIYPAILLCSIVSHAKQAVHPNNGNSKSNFKSHFSEHGDVSLGDRNRENVKKRMEGRSLIDG